MKIIESFNNSHKKKTLNLSRSNCYIEYYCKLVTSIKNILDGSRKTGGWNVEILQFLLIYLVV